MADQQKGRRHRRAQSQAPAQSLWGCAEATPPRPETKGAEAKPFAGRWAAALLSGLQVVVAGCFFGCRVTHQVGVVAVSVFIAATGLVALALTLALAFALARLLARPPCSATALATARSSAEILVPFVLAKQVALSAALGARAPQRFAQVGEL